MAARIDGVDLSHWQSGALNFDQAKRGGVLFVCHKATESTNYTDPLHARRRRQVDKADIVFGSYHFARPSASSGAAQAKHFLAHAKPRKGDLRPMLDLEDRGSLTTAQLTRWVHDFAAEVRRQLHSGILIYTPFDLDDHDDHPLWVARYSDAMTAPVIPRPWDSYTIWQFSNGQYGHPNTAPGIGHCDLNTINSTQPGKLLELFRIGAVGPAPAPTPKPAPTPAPTPAHPDDGRLTRQQRARQLLRRTLRLLSPRAPR